MNYIPNKLLATSKVAVTYGRFQCKHWIDGFKYMDLLVHGPGAICFPPRDFCKPCFLVRLWYTKAIAIVLTEQFLRAFGPRVENKLNIYIFDPLAKKG